MRETTTTWQALPTLPASEGGAPWPPPGTASQDTEVRARMESLDSLERLEFWLLLFEAETRKPSLPPLDSDQLAARLQKTRKSPK